MSLFRETTLTCPQCDHPIPFLESDSVNVDRNPDPRDAIIDGSFQLVACPSCENAVRLEPQFNYLDTADGLWIAGFPGRMMADYLALEDTITDVFSNAYGAGAQSAAQRIGDTLTARLTFGWPALREKLVLAQAGLDDVIVEMLKLDLLRRLPKASMGPGMELRVLAANETSLSFGWILTNQELVAQEFSVMRPLYAAIVDNPEGWASIRAQLTDGPFVDMQKLYMGDGRKPSD